MSTKLIETSRELATRSGLIKSAREDRGGEANGVSDSTTHKWKSDNTIWRLHKLGYFPQELFSLWNKTVNKQPWVRVHPWRGGWALLSEAIMKVWDVISFSHYGFSDRRAGSRNHACQCLARHFPSISQGYVSLFLVYRFLGYSLNGSRYIYKLKNANWIAVSCIVLY